ncbi:hypothetical protein Glove_103g233 [Diversispora epigaea]|uniref:non-reducing end alpha-L-arabinofuranosidase n=1 Tax=Diversispora epigaea TaxID=1348612 RepID=A0A397J7Y6_9GLOM|nr:hypothetical protein Glove_103g233 [Diversispora epigaea]
MKTTQTPAAGQVGTFESSNLPGYYIDFVKGAAYVNEILNSTPVGDFIFKIIPGLDGGNTITFESVTYPGHYLVHDNYRISLEAPNNVPLIFNQSGSFKVSENKDNKGTGYRFESSNYSGYFIRHRNNQQLTELWLDDKDHGSDLIQDSTFDYHLCFNYDMSA